HLREVALQRAKMHGAVCILGSATPSLEAMQKTLDGEIQFLELKERAVAAPAPEVKLVDMRKEKTKYALGPTLKQALEARLKAHEMTILFLNRRGFYRFFRCPSCGWVARCPNCDVAMVQHGGKEGLLCHYCSYRSMVLKSCPECHHDKLFAGGYGTERV